MQPDYLLIFCEGLNAPRSQALTQINLRTVRLILRQQPESADFGDAFRGVPLLDLNGVHILPHLHMTDVHLILRFNSSFSVGVYVAIEYLGLKF